MRTQEAGSQKNQSTLVGSTIAMAKAADRVMKKYAEDSELLALVTEASHARRLAMKKELHKDYGSVCSTVVGRSEFLFGDLSKLTKDITDADKLMKKMRSPRSTGRGDMYRAHSHRTHGSFASRGENRFHPYQYHGSKNSNFLGRSPYPKFKKKKEGGEKPQRH